MCSRGSPGAKAAVFMLLLTFSRKGLAASARQRVKRNRPRGLPRMSSMQEMEWKKNSLWTSSFHCTRAFLAVNEKRGRSEGLGPPTSAKALVRRLCVERLAQSSAVARLQSARTKHNSRSELSLFLKRSLDLFQASH